MKTNAAVLYEVNEPMVVETLDLDEPGEGEVLVRLAAAGVCHSDLHVMKGEWTFPLPMVLGHEGAGRVERVGPGVKNVEPADPVRKLLPSALKATVQTGPLWISGLPSAAPVCASHSRAVLSSLPVKTSVPSGLIATAWIGPPCMSGRPTSRAQAPIRAQALARRAVRKRVS